MQPWGVALLLAGLLLRSFGVRANAQAQVCRDFDNLTVCADGFVQLVTVPEEHPAIVTRPVSISASAMFP